LAGMETILRYRGREVSEADAAFIRALIAAHPGACRRALSRELCLAWNWRQANGALRDMVCRGLMLALHRAGQIELPPVRHVRPNPLAQRRAPAPVEIEFEPVHGRLAQVTPVEFQEVRHTRRERLFNSLMQQHHYLGYTQPVGEQLKYMVYGGRQLLACLAWSSAPRHLGARDRYIGWNQALRRRNIHLLAYNTRYLILPWVEVRYLASHILSRMVRVLSADWERIYGHPVYFCETFIDPARNRGSCYRAANWVSLGLTTGRGKNAPSSKPTRSVKEVLGYALVPDFRARLGVVE
jgi:hypothetical protein